MYIIDKMSNKKDKKMSMEYIDNLIKKAEKKSLTNEDIMKLCNGKVNIMTYENLTSYDNIDKCLEPYGALIMLYETRNNYGHWVCILKHKKKKLEFFDSYGLMPDDELKFVPNNFREINNMMYPHLTYLLEKSGCNIEYNHTKLQSKLDDVNTCGRWVSMRVNMRNYALPKFVNFFTKNNDRNPDWLCTALTLLI